MQRIEEFTLHRVWTGLSDDEFFWEPVVGAWSVRPREQCRTPTPFGDGDWVADFDHERAVAADRGGPLEPMTTIGWLLWHIGSMPGRLAEIDFLGGTRTLASGWTSPYLSYHPVFLSAHDATATLRAGWNTLGTALENATDEHLERPAPRPTYSVEPPRAGLAVLGPPGAERPGYFSVAAVLNEVSHHGAQVCTVRDLYWWTR